MIVYKSIYLSYFNKQLANFLICFYRLNSGGCGNIGYVENQEYRNGERNAKNAGNVAKHSGECCKTSFKHIVHILLYIFLIVIYSHCIYVITKSAHKEIFCFNSHFLIVFVLATCNTSLGQPTLWIL